MSESLPPPIIETLRREVIGAGLSYQELSRRTGVSQGQLSRFTTAQRDLTLAVASRLCQILGLSLVRTAPVRIEPLVEPPPSTRRRRREGLPAPETAEHRGQGKRVDLDAAKKAEEAKRVPRRRGSRKK